MRTTIELDDTIIAELRQLAHRRGVSLRQVVNEALRKSLIDHGGNLSRPRFRCPSYKMGQPTSAVNLDKALALAGSLEDEQVVNELESRK